ncbi:hypothetical protein AAG570_004872 [Ranatra chinensis]|uniref:Zinc finger MYND domain-containing protein 11 n=1 Tax=Ranatra chinensis TaxID=642074 RepID=A0ABD0YDQ8_9HEMI
MSRRRMSCPQAVQQLWDAVKVIRYQRQVPSLERIVKYMYRVNTMSEEEVTRQLGYCVRDGLLVITKRKGLKGKKLGVEQEGYKLPDTMDSSDKHDWYCSECHIGGDVICCGGCWRVYHLSCINNLPGTKHKYLCSICQSCESEETLNIKQKRLNKLLSLACASLKDRYSFLVNSSDMLQRSINIGSPGAQIDIGSENWRTKYLISETMDIARMMSKSGKREYTHLAQFIADVHTIVHNVVIFHGVHSNMADNARQMLRDCTSEVSQIRACHTCYEASVTKPTRHWFCLPCKPPHTLVYAKAKGYSYWPAKVIKVEGEKYEVRFFGGAHCRATVDKSAIEPISVNPNSLQVKRSPSWSKACEELKRHQEMLAKNVNPDSSSSSDSVSSIHPFFFYYLLWPNGDTGLTCQ